MDHTDIPTAFPCFAPPVKRKVQVATYDAPRDEHIGKIVNPFINQHIVIPALIFWKGSDDTELRDECGA